MKNFGMASATCVTSYMMPKSSGTPHIFKAWSFPHASEKGSKSHAAQVRSLRADVKGEKENSMGARGGGGNPWELVKILHSNSF